MAVFMRDRAGRYYAKVFERVETRAEAFVFRELEETPPRETFEEAHADYGATAQRRHNERIAAATAKKVRA